MDAAETYAYLFLVEAQAETVVLGRSDDGKVVLVLVALQDDGGMEFIPTFSLPYPMGPMAEA